MNQTISVESRLFAAYQKTVSHTQVNEKSEKDDGNQPAVEKSTKLSRQNAAVIEASVSLSIQQGDEDMTALYQKAISAIDAELYDIMGENAIQNAYDSGLDVSPEATADRIVNMSTGFLPAFMAQNPDMADDEALAAFMETIRGGIDNGFEEASAILDSLNVLQGDIASNIDKTYDLVQEGLLAFEQAVFELSPPEETEEVS